jgi:hypothetical protein
MLRELSAFNSVELKGHRVDLSASGLETSEIAFVGPADGIQDSNLVALSDDRRNR